MVGTRIFLSFLTNYYTMATFNGQRIKDTLVGNPVGMFLSTILCISFIQWTGQRFLSNYCHIGGFMGFITNPLNLGSPVCVAVNNIQCALVNHCVTIWAGAAAFCAPWLVQRLASPIPTQVVN